MDRITKKLVEEFNLSVELNRDEEFKQFENFCNYSIIANVYTKSFEINSVDTGEGNDTGIDGVAIIPPLSPRPVLPAFPITIRSSYGFTRIMRGFCQCGV